MTFELHHVEAQMDVHSDAASDQGGQSASKLGYVAPVLVNMGSANRDTANGAGPIIPDGATLS